MNIDKYLVVPGAPGVHKLVSSRANGVIIDDRKEGRTRFVPVRQQQITPLATVAVYTFTDEGESTVPLVEVFQKMLDLHDTTPPADPKASSPELRAYFTAVLPEHDRDRVHIGDIQKCIKWYNFMREHGIFEEAKREAEKIAAETAEAEKAETLPAVAIPPAEPRRAGAEEGAEATKKKPAKQSAATMEAEPELEVEKPAKKAAKAKK
ncbi:MAG: hypothetical protein Q7T20_01385 [Saprospiraceae bacterium]|nr:hypothetical protein [Saprospiraceae bacterium]